MKWPITYDKKTMTLYIDIKKKGKKYFRCFSCPFRTWWKARKFFKAPKFKFYFGPTFKYKGHVVTKFGEYDDYVQKGFYPFASTKFLEWHTSKWFPVYVMSWDIGWKDKYSSPRYEMPGMFIIFFGRHYRTSWQLSLLVTAPRIICDNDCTQIDHPDNYWESILDYSYYTEGKNDFEKLLNSREKGKLNHWMTSKSISINEDEYIITNTTEEEFHGKKYLVVTYKSEKIRNLCEALPEFNNTEQFTFHFNNKIIFNDYVYNSLDSEDEIDIWWRIDNNINIEELLKDNDIDKGEINKNIRIDLGPSFKDEFLNKKTQQLISEYYENNKKEK